MESILTSIKQLLGIAEEYEHFDPNIIMHINSVFMTLTQLGVGPAEGFMIEDDTSTWNDFTTDVNVLNAIKSYMYMKVRLLFDPPDRSVTDSYNRMISELEWRLNIHSDTGLTENINSEGG